MLEIVLMSFGPDVGGGAPTSSGPIQAMFARASAVANPGEFFDALKAHVNALISSGALVARSVGTAYATKPILIDDLVLTAEHKSALATSGSGVSG